MPSATVGTLVIAALLLFYSSASITKASAWATQGLSSRQSHITMFASTASGSKPKPNLPIPDPIYSDTPGTWAYDTMSRRVDEEILQRTYEDNKDVWETEEFKDILERFNTLRHELQNAGDTKIQLPLPPPDGSSPSRQTEWEEWKQILDPFVLKGDTWLTAPWMVTEFYVYRRLLVDVIRYWDEHERDGSKKNPGYLYDPFVAQKRAGLESSVASAEGVLGKINNLVTTKNDSIDQGTKLAASIALWGNKMDLSLWPADTKTATQDIFSAILDKAQEGLLHDDSEVLVERCEKLLSKGGGSVDIIVDNAGFELITDLALAQYLIESGIAKCVTFQLKSHPTFVSDALEKDLLDHVNHYAQVIDEVAYPNARLSGCKWQEFLKDGKWKCSENNFWVQGFPMWEMTEPLWTDLHERCDLAFVKGDANYRRLLGDCQWDFSEASFQEVVGHYFPCPVCALRTLKAEIGCGMESNQVERANKLDPNWQTNGRFGVLHYGKGC